MVYLCFKFCVCTKGQVPVLIYRSYWYIAGISIDSLMIRTRNSNYPGTWYFKAGFSCCYTSTPQTTVQFWKQTYAISHHETCSRTYCFRIAKFSHTAHGTGKDVLVDEIVQLCILFTVSNPTVCSVFGYSSFALQFYCPLWPGIGHA